MFARAMFATKIGRRPRAKPLTLMLTAALALGLACSADAQNLIQNPDFANGLTGYIVSSGAVTTTTYSGHTVADIPGFESGLSTQYIIQSFATTAGAKYIFSFLAAAASANMAAVFQAELTPTNEGFQGGGIGNLFMSISSTTLTQYSVTGTASGANTSIAIFSEGAAGDLYVTSLDVEPAPAPVIGGGITSLCMGLAGLVIHRTRRRPGLRHFS